MSMQTAVPDAALATMCTCKLYSVDVGTEQGERSRQAIKARADPIVQGGLGKTLLFPIIVHKHLSIFSRTGKTDCLLPVSAESTRGHVRPHTSLVLESTVATRHHNTHNPDSER